MGSSRRDRPDERVCAPAREVWAPPVRTAAQGDAGADRPRRKRVLIVDDSATALKLEASLLADDFEILTARDGEEAVAVAASQQPDLVVLDIMMPRMDGLEACRRIRANTVTRRIPIVLVTTRDEMESMEAGYSSGCNEYVLKPIDGGELRSKVRDLLGV